MKDKELRERFERVDARFEEVRRGIHDSYESLARIFATALLDTREALERRIDGVEAKLDAFREETHGNFDDVYHRFDHLETEHYAIKAGLNRVEKRFSEDA